MGLPILLPTIVGLATMGVSIAAIVAFFYMAKNISIIRKKLEDDGRQYRVKYEVSLALGEKDEAYRALLYLFYMEWEKVERRTHKQHGYEQAKKLYANEFVALGKECPGYDSQVK